MFNVPMQPLTYPVKPFLIADCCCCSVSFPNYNLSAISLRTCSYCSPHCRELGGHHVEADLSRREASTARRSSRGRTPERLVRGQEASGQGASSKDLAQSGALRALGEPCAPCHVRGRKGSLRVSAEVMGRAAESGGSLCENVSRSPTHII